MPQLAKAERLRLRPDRLRLGPARATTWTRCFGMLVSAMPEGPKYFPDDMMTDQPERVHLRGDHPRKGAVTTCGTRCPTAWAWTCFQSRKCGRGLTEIHANLYCERASHKSIIIGKQGAMLGKIGSEARVDIEKLLGTKVMLRAVGQGARGLAQPRRRSAHPGLRGRLNARADHRRAGVAPRRLRATTTAWSRCLRRNTGGMDAVARGCRRPKSPLVERRRALHQRRIPALFPQGRALHHRAVPDASESFYELRTDYDRLLHGAYWLRLLDDGRGTARRARAATCFSCWRCRALAHLNYAPICRRRC